MLCGYFDESGEHDRKSGVAVRLTVAGCIAPHGIWLEFEDEWKSVLHRYHIQEFHTTEFASKKAGRRSPYRGWEPEKRASFLTELLEVMNKRIHYFAAAKILCDFPDRGIRDSCTDGILKMMVIPRPNGPDLHWSDDETMS